MEKIKITKKRISRKTVCEYSLHSENSEFSISCCELDKNGEITDYSQVKNAFSNLEKANDAYCKIIKHKVSACTLYDVIYDLIC